MNIISHNVIDNKIIELRDDFVIIDRDVGELYGVETKRINEAVTNNPDKFPNDYMFELTKDEKTKVVEYFDHLQPIKYSPYLPKAFTKKSGEIIAELLEVPEEYDTDTETSVEVNFGLLKYKRTVKKVHKKENAKDAKN